MKHGTLLLGHLVTWSPGHLVTCTVLLICLVPAPSWAQDFNRDRLDNWHQWRGPEATGVAPRGEPPVQWGEKTNVKWKTPLPGRGSSTPIVWGDQVFVLTASDTGRQADPKDIAKPDPRFESKTRPPTTIHQYVVTSIDRQTGKVRWQQVAVEQVPHQGHHETHSYAAFSPTTDGKHLYVSFGSRGLFCYDLAGKLQWKTDPGDMHTRFGWGEASSPVIAGDTLIVNWDHEGQSFILALAARTGKVRWKMDRTEPTSWSTPLVVEHQGKTQVIVNATNRVRSYDLATGKVLWECGGQTVNVIPSPVSADGMVYCLSGYRGGAGLAIPLDSQGDVTGKSVWRIERGTPYVPSPVLSAGRLWFTQGNLGLLTCMEAATGKPIIDRERLPGLASLYASPVAAAGRIYFVGRDGTALVLKQADKLEVLATSRLDDAIDASPAVVGKQLFLRGAKHLYCIEGK
jgi:outer membrane protein assembly factor BamB